MAQPILKIDDFSYAYPGGGTVLNRIQLEMTAGECICITGPTGSGKSTLLLAIKALLPPGRQSGTIRINSASGQADPVTGLVMQNPETQLLGNSVGAETAFGLENLCVPPKEMRPAVQEALAAVGLNLSLDFPVGHLSMGQKYRLILASVLAMSPSVILLDEPGAQLDPAGIASLNWIIAGLKARGIGVILCEHHPQDFAGVIDTHRQLDEGGFLRRGSQGMTPPAGGPPSGRRGGSLHARTVVRARQLCVRRDDQTPIWSAVDLDIRPGQRVGVYGDNGTGKTTLVRCLTGFVPPWGGAVSVFGHSPSPKRLRGSTGCLFQNPQKQLFENTVFDEVAFPLKRKNVPAPQRNDAVNALLKDMGLAGLAGMSPHKLSFGQKHLVVLASALAFSPRLLILDDPFAGLDFEWRKMIRSFLVRLSETDGTALLWTGHRLDEMAHHADVIYHVSGGTLVREA